MKKPAGYEDYNAALARAYRAPHATACAIIENLSHYYRKTTREVTADFNAIYGPGAI